MATCLNTRGRHWCLTLFYSSEWDTAEKLIESFVKNAKIINYIFQLEQCPTTSKKHWQIYIETSQVRFRTLKPSLMKGCHIELARNKQAARLYSMKSSTKLEGPWHNICESDFQELTKKVQGSGKSISEIYQEICQGKITKVEDVAAQNVGVFLRHERSLNSLISSRTKERHHKTVVIYLYGATGVGKSRLSRSVSLKLSDGAEAYYKSDGKWWDMYQNEKCVIWDDFRGKSYLFSETLKLLDRYPYKVETKGSMMKFNSEFVFITSNVSPYSVYSVISKDAFIRRLDFVVNLESFDGTNIKATVKDNETFNCNLEDFIEMLSNMNNDYKMRCQKCRREPSILQKIDNRTFRSNEARYLSQSVLGGRRRIR